MESARQMERKTPMAKRNPIRTLKVPKDATLRQIYRRVREEFTAADLQKFTVIEPMIPGEKISPTIQMS
jgi:hypothetical protein